MTRDVICYLINNTNLGYNPTKTNLRHGENRIHPQVIAPSSQNSGQQEIFYFDKTGGSMQGTSGTVSYLLSDGSTLMFAFNCPFTMDGTSGMSNCYFYACITNVQSKGSSYYLTIENTPPMDPTSPNNSDTVSAIVTLNMS